MPNLGQTRWFFEPCDLEIWCMTLKNNRAPLLSNIKLYASLHHHMWFQTGVTVRKRLSWVMTSATLTFDVWPLPFAWTSLLSLVITPENFMMIQWWEHSRKGVTDRQTDGLNHWQSCSVAAKNTSQWLVFLAATKQLYQWSLQTESSSCHLCCHQWHQLVYITTTAGATIDDKVGIMQTLGFQRSHDIKTGNITFISSKYLMV